MYFIHFQTFKPLPLYHIIAGKSSADCTKNSAGEALYRAILFVKKVKSLLGNFFAFAGKGNVRTDSHKLNKSHKCKESL